MSGAQSAKGNPATKRMMNANLKARRAASWARGERRKKATVEAQIAREVANKDALGPVYDSRVTKTKTRVETVWVGGHIETVIRERQVSKSPSRQLRSAVRAKKPVVRS